MRRLQIGSGRDPRAGYVNLDLVALPEVDVVADLERPLPFGDGSFDEVLALHVLEHVVAYQSVLEEIHRVLAPGGRLCAAVPHFSSAAAHTDPTHRRFFGYFSFDYFTADGTYNFYSRLRFRMRKRELRWYWIKNERRTLRSRLISGLINAWPLAYERFFCWILPTNELYVELEPVPAVANERKRSS